MLVTDDGIVTDVREVQPWKTCKPRLVTDDGMAKVNDVREVQPMKARIPMEVTEDGIVTDVREVH